MLQSMLLKIEKIASNEVLMNVDINDFRDFFRSYKKGMRVYPGVVIKKLKLEPKLTYQFLMDLEKAQILKGYYELYCVDCQKTVAKVEIFKDIPETFTCDYCNQELSGIENSIVVYEVIDEGTRWYFILKALK